MESVRFSFQILRLWSYLELKRFEIASMSRVIVKNLPADCTDEALRTLVSRVGTVTDVALKVPHLFTRGIRALNSDTKYLN